MNKLCRLIASCGYLGELPAGGTWGSLVGWVLAWYFSSYALWLFFSILILGYGLSLIANESFGEKDPSAFVLDEVCGMMLSVLLLPKTLPIYLTAFVLFRLLDIWKPWPISVLQKMEHPFSIMHDDIAAGLFTHLMVRAAFRIFF